MFWMLRRGLFALPGVLLSEGLYIPASSQASPSVFPSALEEVDSDVLSGIVAGWSNRSLQAVWSSYQDALSGRLQRTYRPLRGSFRTLVVSPVKNSHDALRNFRDNLHTLVGNKAGDIFEFALFHYDGNNSRWVKQQWYADKSGSVVMKELRPLCKAQAWKRITPSMAQQYDFIWLMDGDLRFDLFSWALYRSVLASLDPLVSQPSILPWRPGRRSTDKHKLRMTGRVRGVFPIAREVERTESMAALISTRLWPAIYQRLQESDLHTVWYLNDFWDMAAHLSALECGKTGALLVNAAPLRHMNFHDLLDGSRVPQRNFTCSRGCGEAGANCRPVSPSEAALLREGLRGHCEVPEGSSGLNCTSGVASCSEALTVLLRSRQWAEMPDGKILDFRYRCKYATGDWRTRLNDDCEAVE